MNNEITFKEKIKNFLRRKNIYISFKVYLIDALSAMALGLFASLLIGTILNTLGIAFNSMHLKELSSYASKASGAAMGIAIGCALKTPPLVLYSLVAVGLASNELAQAGGPIAVLLISIVASEFGKIVSKETKIDILITPLVTILIGCGLSFLIAPQIGYIASKVGEAIKYATNLQPFLMGIFIAVVVGICLTLPISSAALCAAFQITGLAGGAALAGCCCQMLGFAFMSFKVNKLSGLISQGIGTSMLQMSNIIKKPVIWLPTIIASAILGPISTCLFKFEMNGEAISSGMGTCGFVGPIGVVSGWFNSIDNNLKHSITFYDITSLVLICFILPIILTLFIHFICLKLKLYTNDDLKLDV